MPTITELQQKQALSLNHKIILTRQRLKEWYEHYDGNVYISFSGGKDSTVLLDIARKMYSDIEAVYVDTGLEYPEVRSFVKSVDNVTWLKPEKTFKQVIEEYGYPMISKEVAECVDGAKRYIKILTDRQTDRQKDRQEYPIQIPYSYHYRRICGIGEYNKQRQRECESVSNTARNVAWNVYEGQQCEYP